MKTSCAPFQFRIPLLEKTMTNEEWVKIAVEIGLDGTEIYGPFLHDMVRSDLERFAGAVGEAGLAASQYTMESHFCNPARRDEAVANVNRAVDHALIFKTDTVRVVSGRGTRGLEHDVVLQSVADGFKACLDYAEDNGVMLAFEDHFNVGTDIQDFMKILELVDDERLKVNLDTANAANGTAADLARLVGERVVHTHLSDRKGDDHFTVVVGQGDIDFASVFKELKKVGHDGWLSTEGYAGGKEGIVAAIDHIKTTWDSV